MVYYLLFVFYVAGIGLSFHIRALSLYAHSINCDDPECDADRWHPYEILLFLIWPLVGFHCLTLYLVGFASKREENA